MKKTVKIKCDIECMFHSYDDKKIDARAEKHIREYVKAVIKDECTYIPLPAVMDEDGDSWEDCTNGVKVKMKKNTQKVTNSPLRVLRFGNRRA